MTPVDKLVRTIQQGLESGALPLNADKLATDYAQWCVTANRRLEQCQRLLEGNAEHEALQLAETPPSLLDLCAALSFDQVEQWRSHCQSKSLAVPEELTEHAISLLNDLYAKGITSAHPLYRDYRQAVAERNDERALSALRTIVRLNPGDASARQEIQRLETKLRDEACARLTRAVHGRDVSAVLQSLEEVETAEWTASLNTDVLGQARAIRQERDRELAFERCCGLVTLLDRLKDREAWTEAIGSIQEVEGLCATHGITLDAESAATFAEVRTWAHALKRRHDEEQQFQAALKAVTFLVTQSEAHSGPGSRFDLKSLREEQRTLHNKWRELEAFAKPVAEELQTRVKRRASVQQAEINRMVRQRRLATTAGIVAAVVTAIIAAVMLFQWRWNNSQISDLGKLQEERRVTASEKFIGDLRHNEPKAVTRTKLALAIQSSEQWVVEERKRLETFQAMLTKLQQHSQSAFKDAPVETIALDLQRAHDFTKELAPEFRNTGESQFLEFENQFDSLLSAAKTKLQQEFEGSLKQADDFASGLEQPDITVDAVRKNATAFADVISHLESMATPPVQTLRLPESLTGQIPPLKARLAPYLEALSKLESAETDMRRATTLEQYLAALEQYDADHLRQLPGVRNARKAIAAKATLLDIERLLLMPQNPDGWQTFIKTPVTPNLPAEVMPAELSKWLSIRDDDNLREIYRYQIPPTETGVTICSPAAREGIVFTRGPWKQPSIDSTGLRFSAEAFVATAEATKAEFAANTVFLCQRNVNQRTDEYQIDKLGGPTPECLLLRRMGLDRWINDAGDKFQQPVLPMLDALRAADSVSVLFKAYIHWRLLEIVAIRPEAWGARTIPAIETDKAALIALGVAELRSDDWMLPVRTQRFQAKLSEFYARTRDVSYAKQAHFFERLLLDAHTAGLKYAGYVGTDGLPMLTAEGSRARNLWGLTDDGQKPTLLWRDGGATAGTTPLALPQQFTPLFYCGREPDELLKSTSDMAQLDWRSETIKSYLPPLFQGEVKP